MTGNALDAVVQIVNLMLCNTLSDLKEPFNLQKGWVLWAVIGLVGAIIAIALTGAAMSLFRGEDPQREVRNDLELFVLKKG